MGSVMSYPLMIPPDFYELPSHEKSKDDDLSDLSKELHELNMSFCENIINEGARSREEHAIFDLYRQNWKKVVADLKMKYPQWTAKDLLNLRQQFKVFDSNDLCLLDYNDFNKALDFYQDNSSPEQRRVMFESLITQHCKFIDFMQYLQLMSDINIQSPVPEAPKTEDSKDPVSLDIISNVRKTDSFVEMCYSLF